MAKPLLEVKDPWGDGFVVNACNETREGHEVMIAEIEWLQESDERNVFLNLEQIDEIIDTLTDIKCQFLLKKLEEVK